MSDLVPILRNDSWFIDRSLVMRVIAITFLDLPAARLIEISSPRL